MSGVAPSNRFTRKNPCPVCGGGHDLQSGREERCYGFLSDDGRYGHCTRENHANGLPLESNGTTYAHRLDGPCRCGRDHSDARPHPLNGNGAASASYSARLPTPERRNAPEVATSASELCPPGYREVGAYSWPDAFGVEQYQTVRYEHLTETQDKKPGKPKKTFRFRRAAGREGLYFSGQGDAPPVVFRKDRLAENPDDDVHFAEGEEGAIALENLGFLATTTAGGAGMVARYPQDELQWATKARRVVIHADNDEDGEKYARTIADAALPVARSVVIVRYGDCGPGGDVVDAIRAGATADDIAKRVAGGVAAIRSQQTERKVRFHTAREFARQTPETTDYIAGRYVAAGAVTKIDGPPKKAGKTTLVTHMIRAVLDGSDFLGTPAKQGAVVMLSEQGGTSLREAFGRAGLLDRDDLHIATYRDMAGVPWPEIVADAASLAVEVGAVLLVVDTLPACSGVRGDDENSAGRALEALEPLQVAADTHGLGVIVSFHDRKGGGEVGDSGRGSTAYAGAVDIIMHITRPGGNFNPTIRKVEALSRFEATPAELYIELTDTGYVALGSEDDVVSAALARALPDILPESEEAAKRIDNATEKDSDGNEHITERGLLDDLAAKHIKASRSTLDAELKRWIAAGYVGQSGAGKRGSPKRYWLVAHPPESFFQSKPQGALEERIAPDADITSPGAFEPAGADPKHSFDAPPPSEESKQAESGPVDLHPFLSSNAPTPYSGGNELLDENDEDADVELIA